MVLGAAKRGATCGDPGPGDAHCTDDYLHQWSHYDATQDKSWNDGQWEFGWFEAAPHECDRPGCPEPGTAAHAAKGWPSSD